LAFLPFGSGADRPLAFRIPSTYAEFRKSTLRPG